MKTKPLTLLLSLTFLVLFSGSSVVFGDDFQDGLDAAQRQDYKTAHRLWLPFAEQGVAEAQALLGMMYDNGQGVPRIPSCSIFSFKNLSHDLNYY